MPSTVSQSQLSWRGFLWLDEEEAVKNATKNENDLRLHRYIKLKSRANKAANLDFI